MDLLPETWQYNPDMFSILDNPSKGLTPRGSWEADHGNTKRNQAVRKGRKVRNHIQRQSRRKNRR